MFSHTITGRVSSFTHRVITPLVTLVVPFLGDESKTKTASISNFTPIVGNAVQMSLRLGKPPYDLMAFVVGDLVSVGH